MPKARIDRFTDTAMKTITGSIVALVTPMHDDGSVDFEALRRLIDWHVAEGTQCIGVVGTTGESPTVSVEEHCEIIRVAVEHAHGRIPVMSPGPSSHSSLGTKSASIFSGTSSRTRAFAARPIRQRLRPKVCSRKTS